MDGNDQKQQKSENLERKLEPCPIAHPGHFMTYCSGYQRECQEASEDTVIVEGIEYLKCDVWKRGNNSM